MVLATGVESWADLFDFLTALHPTVPSSEINVGLWQNCLEWLEIRGPL